MIKTYDACFKCKWHKNNPGCASNIACSTCTHTNYYGSCLCSTIERGEDCPYYDTGNDLERHCNLCSAMENMVGPVKIISKRDIDYELEVKLNFCPVCGNDLRKE